MGKGKPEKRIMAKKRKDRRKLKHERNVRRKERRKQKRSLYFTNRKAYYKGKEKAEKKPKKGEAGRKFIKSRIERGAKRERKGSKTARPVKIDRVFKKGITKLTIANILEKPESEINNEYKPIFKKVLNDKGLGDFAQESVLNSMVLQENINKIKWRFDIKAEVYDPNEKKIMEMRKGSDGSLLELKQLTSGRMKEGVSVDYDIDLGKGYLFKMIEKGNIKRIQVTLIFRS